MCGINVPPVLWNHCIPHSQEGVGHSEVGVDESVVAGQEVAMDEEEADKISDLTIC